MVVWESTLSSPRKIDLLYATECGYVENVSLLLNKGSDPDIKNIFGYTPLMIASINGYVEIVSLLINAGADPDITDYTYRCALTYAMIKKRYNIIKLLLPITSMTIFDCTFAINNKKIIKILLETVSPIHLSEIFNVYDIKKLNIKIINRYLICVPFMSRKNKRSIYNVIRIMKEYI
jgi:ankyrin repeat protein